MRWIYVIRDLNGKEIVGTFYGKEFQKQNQREFRLKQVNKRKGYDNSFNNLVDKTDIVL